MFFTYPVLLTTAHLIIIPMPRCWYSTGPVEKDSLPDIFPYTGVKPFQILQQLHWNNESKDHNINSNILLTNKFIIKIKLLQPINRRSKVSGFVSGSH